MRASVCVYVHVWVSVQHAYSMSIEHLAFIHVSIRHTWCFVWAVTPVHESEASKFIGDTGEITYRQRVWMCRRLSMATNEKQKSFFKRDCDICFLYIYCGKCPNNSIHTEWVRVRVAVVLATHAHTRARCNENNNQTLRHWRHVCKHTMRRMETRSRSSAEETNATQRNNLTTKRTTSGRWKCMQISRADWKCLAASFIMFLQYSVWFLCQYFRD